MRAFIISALLIVLIASVAFAQTAPRGSRGSAVQPAAPAVAPQPLEPSMSGEPLEPLPQVKLPLLTQTLSDLLDKLFKGSGRAGVILKADQNKVYIDLGAADNARIGDEFEVVTKVTELKNPATGEVAGEDREVIGRLRVTNVQPKLSVCELISGRADQKTEQGELCKVLPARDVKKVKAVLGKLTRDPAAGLSVQTLTQALAAACGGSDRLELVDAAQAEYELRAQTSKAARGVQLALALVELKSGRTVSQSEGLHKTVLTAADLGLKAALVVDLKTEVNLDAAFAAARKAGTVRRVEGALLFPSVGARRHLAVLYSDGRMVVAQQKALSGIRDVDALKETGMYLCGMIRELQSESSKGDGRDVPRPSKPLSPSHEVQADAEKCVMVHSRVFTDAPPMYRQITFTNLDNCDYVLSIPDCELREARLSAIVDIGWNQGVWDGRFDLSIDETKVIDGESICARIRAAREKHVETADRQTFVHDITRLCCYGEHSLAVTSARHKSSTVVLKFLLTAPPDVWVTVCDKASNPKGTLNGVSGLTADLELPPEIGSPASAEQSPAEPEPIPQVKSPAAPTAPVPSKPTPRR